MSWLVLFVSGAFEAVWAVALGKSDGLTRLVPSLVFGIGLTLSMFGLAYAMRTLPIGTAYAVWVGIGASLTITYGALIGDEQISPVRILLLIALVGCIVGLKVCN